MPLLVPSFRLSQSSSLFSSRFSSPFGVTLIEYLKTRIPGAIVDPANCKECRGRRDGVQVYSCIRLHDKSKLVWDIELALQLCQDGRQPVLFDNEHVQAVLQVNQIDPMHLAHVDPWIPGIAVELGKNDAGLAILTLIDGSHRAAQCLELGIAFYVYVLSEEESHLCQETELAKAFLLVDAYQSKCKERPPQPTQFHADCEECQIKRNSPRVFTFERSDARAFAWSIDLAIAICSDGRTTFPVPPADLETIPGVNQISERHLEHVDPDIPGIACVCGVLLGQPMLVLIDGSDRAARCLREKRPFLVCLLSEEESERCQQRVPQLLTEFLPKASTL